MSAALLDLSAVVGPVPNAITVAGTAAIVALLARRGRRWWTVVVPLLVVGAVAVAAAAGLVVDRWWRPFPDPLPVRVLAWGAVAVFASGVAVAAAFRAGLRRRLLTAVLLVIALTLPAMKINAFYGYYPTLRAAFGIPDANAVDLADVPAAATVVTAPPGQDLASVWQPPPDQPATGRVAQVDIPGVRSGFSARPAAVYLPPAYLSAQRRPLLPVLVLVAGQPGGPQDWLVAGKLAAVMDRFAAANRGLAPVVVVPDATGAPLANPLCLDSRLGNVETYLARDVPEWAATTLQVDTAPGRRAIGGFSYGGTCALQLAVRAPAEYPTFLDISGQAEPTLGNRDLTVAAAFGGDQAAFAAVNPADVLASTTLPASAGVFAVGRDDAEYEPQARAMLEATRRAGMDVRLDPQPGGHAWPVATAALEAALPWLAQRAGLLPPAR